MIAYHQTKTLIIRFFVLMPPILRNASFLFILQSQPFYQAPLPFLSSVSRRHLVHAYKAGGAEFGHDERTGQADGGQGEGVWCMRVGLWARCRRRYWRRECKCVGSS